MILGSVASRAKPQHVNIYEQMCVVIQLVLLYVCDVSALVSTGTLEVSVWERLILRQN